MQFDVEYCNDTWYVGTSVHIGRASTYAVGEGTTVWEALADCLIRDVPQARKELQRACDILKQYPPETEKQIMWKEKSTNIWRRDVGQFFLHAVKLMPPQKTPEGILPAEYGFTVYCKGYGYGPGMETMVSSETHQYFSLEDAQKAAVESLKEILSKTIKAL